MDENKLVNKFGEELPLPPENPIEDGIVVPVTPEDGENKNN